MPSSIARGQEVGAAAEPAVSVPLEAAEAEWPQVVIEPEAPATKRRGRRKWDPWWRDSRRRRMLAWADLAAAGTAAAVASAISGAPAWLICAAPVWLLYAKLLGLYDGDHKAIRHLTVDELGRLSALASLGTLTFLALVVDTSGWPGTASVLVMFSVGLGTVIAFRAGARAIWRRITPPELTLVVGDPELARAFRKKVRLLPDMHLAVGATRALGHDDAVHLDDAVLERIDRLVLACKAPNPDLITQLASRCRRSRVKLSVACSLTGYSRPSPKMSRVVELPVLEYTTWDVPRTTVLGKRLFDITVSAAALAILAPVLLVIAIAIRLETPGPILFRQRRVGKERQPFDMLKFRSMIADAETASFDRVGLNEIELALAKPASDPRVTRVGRFLRRSSLDEIPQLWNVLRGDMSLVGPRPERPAVVAAFEDEFAGRLAVKPGITGPMQVFGRGQLTFPERAALEIEYVENLSFTRDLHILAMTMPAAIRGTGAF